MPDTLDSSVLVEPVPPGITVELRQLSLHGDQLKTTILDGSHPQQLTTRTYMKVDPGDNLKYKMHISNTGSRPGIVLMCIGMTRLSCLTPSQRIPIPPYSDISTPFPDIPVAGYLIFTKPEEVIVGGYHGVEGITSTFNASTSVTFGAPVKQ